MNSIHGPLHIHILPENREQLFIVGKNFFFKKNLTNFFLLVIITAQKKVHKILTAAMQ